MTGHTHERTRDEGVPVGHARAAGALGRRWSTWRGALALVAIVLIARVVYLMWLSPYELAGDEAYYWECARHPSLCYYEKGPGLPWMLAICCRMFGDREWSVRLPVALSSAAAALVVARLAMTTAAGDGRVGFLAAALFCLIPAFQANAQICTQDGPLILIWALLAAAGLRLVRRWEAGTFGFGEWASPAFVLGVGFLFKQSILLFVTGLVVYAALRRRHLRWSPRLVPMVAAALVVFVATISPVLVWNHAHGWPTLAHTLGHLGAPGGDQDPSRAAGSSPLWFLSLVGSQLGVVGLPAIGLMAVACAWAIRSRRTEPDRWPDRLWLLCCALPSIGFFVLLSLFKPVIGTWPFPSYVTLVALAAALLSRELYPSGRAAAPPIDAPPDAARAGGGAVSQMWEVAVIWGVVGGLIVCFPNWIAAMPGVGEKFQRSVLKRVSGHRRHAAELQALIDANIDPQGRPPVVVARYYMDAALDAFYLPGRPTVYNAGTATGQRMTSYDFWRQTDLSSPALRGRSVVLDGGSQTHPWDTAMRFETLAQEPGRKLYVATGYGGLRPAPDGGVARAPARSAEDANDDLERR